MKVVRVLWGDQRSLKWYHVTFSDIRKWRVQDEHPDCQWVYVYGRNNADFLTHLKIPNVVLVNSDSWPDGAVDSPCPKLGCKVGEVGVKHPWRYKFELLKQALKDHGEVVYCDWDVGFRRQDIGYVAAKLEGRDRTFCLFHYKTARHPNRREWRARRLGVTGRWLHFRGTEFADLVLARMLGPETEWSWHDELVMGRLLDEEHGRWMGDAEWLQKFESPIMSLPDCWSPWKRASDDGRFVTRETPVPFTWERVFA